MSLPTYKCVQDLKSVADTFKAELSFSGGCLYCDSPSGFVWKASGETCLCEQVEYNRGEKKTAWAEGCREMESRMKYGIEKVEDEKELERIRYELDDDNWGR